MTRQSRPAHRNQSPFPVSGLQRTFVATCTLMLTLGGHSIAQDYSVPVAMPTETSLPEAILVPIKIDGAPLAAGGWILLYNNGLRGPETPDREIGSRTVTTNGTDAGPMEDVVTWEITRTQNNLCDDHAKKPCPDILRILSVPTGFIAVPSTAKVDERSVQRVFIVPQGVG